MLFKNYKTTFENPLFLNSVRLFFNKTPFGTIYLTNIATKSVNTYLENIDKLSNDSYISINYEQLCKKPNETMSKIFNFLKINDSQKDFKLYIKPRKTQYDPNIIYLQNYISKKMKRYFDFFNYKYKI